MDRAKAKIIAEKELQYILKSEPKEIIKLLEDSDYKQVQIDGVDYQIETTAFWDDEEMRTTKYCVYLY